MDVHGLLRSTFDGELHWVSNEKVAVGLRVDDISVMRLQALEKVLCRNDLIIQTDSHILRKTLERAGLETTPAKRAQER